MTIYVPGTQEKDLSKVIMSLQNIASKLGGTSGQIGETVSSRIALASGIAITTATPKTITSIDLSAGEWGVSCVQSFLPANTTSVTQIVTSISATTDTLDGTEGRLGVLTIPATVFDGATQAQVSLPMYRLTLAATTTIYMVAMSKFTVSTNKAFGYIQGVRVAV